ncbi:MAG TPA: N-acetyl-gamma-glutamyl-phosphate reductase [Elusimicrobia bacterium]|nr:N-acetyl-gamma-glutamyl-phosphate reductase [Elusimicrobiota bacterium]
MKRARAGVVGGAGYVGGELLRLLLSHPRAEIAAVASRSHAGKPVEAVHPHLRPLSGLNFTAELDPSGLDCVFLAGRHGEAMGRMAALLERAGPACKVVDLSADFRLRDASLYPAWYGREHAAPELLGSFVYGLAEYNREPLRRASRVANPGCFATALSLALGPLAAAGVAGRARVTAVTGSSGSGASPSAGTHHPSREGTLRAYKPLQHQHVPEVEAFLDGLAGKPSLRLALVPVSGPFVRGIYAVCHVDLPPGLSEAELRGLYERAYAGARFVRLCSAPPDLKAVAGGNHCDLHVCAREGCAVVIAAIDNLVKGAAGQAVQNMNLMLGFDEGLGLDQPGAYP